MAKQDKDKQPKSRKTEKKSADPAAPKKPTLFKRIVKTIESIAKDKKTKVSEEESRKASEASRKQSLDHAVEELSTSSSASSSDSVPPVEVPTPIEAKPEPESKETKKKPKSEKKKHDDAGSEKDPKKSVELPNKVIIESPPVSHVYGVSAPDFPATAAKAAKYDIEPPHAPAVRKPMAPVVLADQIFSTRLVLLVRDPETIYAYWDIRDEDRRLHRLDAILPPRHLALRLYDHGREAQPSMHAHVYVDFLLQPGVDSRYLKLPLKDRWWRADLGIKDEMVGFTALARSNTVRSPRDQISEGAIGARPMPPLPATAPIIATTPGAIQSATAPAAEPLSPETIFHHTFRLSGGSFHGVDPATEEIMESHTETRTTMRVRAVGSSAMTPEEERESLTTLKVRRIGASDLTSRQS